MYNNKKNGWKLTPFLHESNKMLDATPTITPSGYSTRLDIKLERENKIDEGKPRLNFQIRIEW